MGGIVREFGIDMYTLPYFKWITNKDLLYSTGDSAQHYVAGWTGGGFGRAKHIETKILYKATLTENNLKTSRLALLQSKL